MMPAAYFANGKTAHMLAPLVSARSSPPNPQSGPGAFLIHAHPDMRRDACQCQDQNAGDDQ